MLRSGRRRSIAVDEHTSRETVIDAFSSITEVHKSRPQYGHPGQDRLLAVECAVLYDLQNARDPADKRHRRWTHQSLYEQYDEIASPRSAKDYIKLGRMILAN
jgi:hypothetical protein